MLHYFYLFITSYYSRRQHTNNGDLHDRNFDLTNTFYPWSECNYSKKWLCNWLTTKFDVLQIYWLLNYLWKSNFEYWEKKREKNHELPKKPRVLYLLELCDMSSTHILLHKEKHNPFCLGSERYFIYKIGGIVATGDGEKMNYSCACGYHLQDEGFL